VLHGSGEDYVIGLDPAVGVPREASQIIRGNIVTEGPSRSRNGSKFRCVAEAERAAQVYSCAFEGWLGLMSPLLVIDIIS